MKHYLDRGGSRTMGYQFLCTCPLGKYCPVSKKAQKVQSYEVDDSDQIGPYIAGYCEDIPGADTAGAYSMKGDNQGVQ